MVESSDVVLEVLDCRDPLGSRCVQVCSSSNAVFYSIHVVRPDLQYDAEVVGIVSIP